LLRFLTYPQALSQNKIQNLVVNHELDEKLSIYEKCLEKRVNIHFKEVQERESERFRLITRSVYSKTQAHLIYEYGRENCFP